MAQTWLGISSFTYPFLSGVNPAQRPAQPLTPLGLIDKAVALDVGCVQYSHNLPFDDFSDATLDEIRVYAQERGILLEAGMKGKMCIRDSLVTAWDTFSAEYPGSASRLEIAGQTVPDMIKELQKIGMYKG